MNNETIQEEVIAEVLPEINVEVVAESLPVDPQDELMCESCQ